MLMDEEENINDPVPLSSFAAPTPEKRSRNKKITTLPEKAVQLEDFIDGPPTNKNDVAPEVENQVQKRKRKAKPVSISTVE